MLFYISNALTFNTPVCSRVFFPGFPVVEAHGAVERVFRVGPLLLQDLEPAADGVVLPSPLSRAVRGYSVFSGLSTDVPGHRHMIRVKTSGHAHQGLLFKVIFVPGMLVFGWWEDFHRRWCDIVIFF